MKIFVTGGAGFIGRNLVEHFVNKNHLVTIFDNFSNSNENNLVSIIKKNAKIVRGDILDRKNLEYELQGHDVVVHLAAKISVKESIENPDETFKVNVDGTENVLHCCEKLKIKKIIVLSSAAVYGNLNSPNELLNEDSPTKPSSPYGQSKLKMEKIIREKTASKMNSIILRLFNIYGKGQSKEYAGVVTEFIEKIKHSKDLDIHGTGKQTRDFINIKDAIAAIDLAVSNINQKQSSVYNIGSGKSISILELAKVLISLSKRDIGIKFTKSRPGDIMYSATSIDKAKAKLGFKPTISPEDGFLDLLD